MGTRGKRIVKGRGSLAPWPSILLLGTVLSCAEKPSITAPELDPSASLLSIGGASIIADAGGPYSGVVGVPITFRASATVVPLDLVLTYTWTFGDGGTRTGATVTYTYSAPGTYTVTLKVTALGGLLGGVVSDSDNTTATIAAPNQAPVARAGGPYSGTAGSAVTFNGSGSSDPDGNLPLTYAWTFGDGRTGTGATPTHTYATAGTYTVTLTVTDAKGKASAPDTSRATIATTTSTTRITGLGTMGTGPAVPGGSRRDFDFDATDAPGGRLFYTDWEIVRSDGTAARLTVDPTSDPETGITFLARSSVDPACVEFGGTGRLDIGELHEFTVVACDYGSPGANLDTFRISVPSRGYDRGDRLSQGEITLSGS